MRLLRANAAFRRLWLARVVSFLGDSLGLVALIIYVTQRTDSGAAVGLLLLAGDFTPSVFAPMLGAIADRSSGRKVLIVCELGQAAAVATIVIVQPSTGVVLVLVAVRSLLAATFQAASRSAVGELVDDADLERANTVLGFGTHGLEAIGPLVAAALLVWFDARAVLGIDVLTFLASPLLLARLPPLTLEVEPEGGVLHEARAGLGAIWQHRIVRVLSVAFWSMAVFTAADDAALPFLGTHVFHSSASPVSLLYAAGGVGVLVGLAVLSRRTRTPVAIAITGMAVGCLGNALTGLAPVLALAYATQAVRGIGNAWIGVGVDTAVQREVPRAMRGRVFANLYGGVGIAAGVSYVAGGTLVDTVGPRAVLTGGGMVGIAIAGAAAFTLRADLSS
jgi:MFS family permease